MGNKKRVKIPRNLPQKNPVLLPIEDDPYWKISTLYIDPHRLDEGYISRFIRYEHEHELWVQHIMDGVPTYYCVLEVHRGASTEQIKKAYEEQQDFSYYDDEILEEAFQALISPVLQRKYDDFLLVFEQISKVMPRTEKEEIIESHADNLLRSRQFSQIRPIKKEFSDHILLVAQGMPDIYKAAGLDRNSDSVTILRDCPRNTALLQRIYAILSDPHTREKYDILLNFIHTNMIPEGIEILEKNKKIWKDCDQKTVESIMLITLNEPSGIDRMMKRAEKILNANQDWKQYLPPSKENFFLILGLEPEMVIGEKKGVEGILRDKYRALDRTTQVNLAYSVLKNTSLREDYLWIYENLGGVTLLQRLMDATVIPRNLEIPEFLSLDDIRKFIGMFSQ